MNNDRDTMRDRNVTDKDLQKQRDTQTAQRSKTERGEIGDEDLDDDTLIDESLRSEIGAGE